jgi:outer membrane protein OmpA-like peptidoglycan-associated protein
VGDEWASPGLWVGAAQRDAQPFTVLVNVAYRYRGVDTYEGRPAHVFEGGYRLEYPYSIDDESRPLVESTGFPSSTDDVSRLTGSHRLTVVVSADGSKLLLVRDVFTNEFALPDGSTRSEEGFTLMFWRTSTPVDDVAEIADAASSVADAAVDRVEEGVRITLSNLRFRPDTATMVAGERSKIDGIAAIIIGRPGRSVLVVGHTADVGRPRGQQELSLERARTVVDELIAAGVNPSRLLFEGRGGTEPLESNATEQGRARNRRVEIILLHDKL